MCFACGNLNLYSYGIKMFYFAPAAVYHEVFHGKAFLESRNQRHLFLVDTENIGLEEASLNRISPVVNWI